ncbi:DUF4349 domain-containing protein [Streptomyces sp. B93]|uniref:DUF4349 domain-containing protein n=1 Tax=Streptomyces sp. B93 TaxID=2824875 RepID=UPI001B36E825|nr:DUF4349 domain-containing protein [Streptomyces sp. B93]MBQ1090377.1 DUF4349 domain-containing protein [Streptomyces sp. B93]
MRTPVSARRRSVRALAGFLLVTALALTGCSGADDSSSDGGGSAEKAVSDARGAAPQEGAAADSGTDEKARDSAPTRPAANRIIRTASLTVQVEDVPKALDAARTAAENAGGFIGSETTTRDEDSAEHTRVVLRVPTDAYQEVLTDLEGTGKLLERTSKAQDVTDQVVDVESRIKTQRASVARIRELMDQATRLSDVVTLEGELSARQADLESLLAQQASLEDRTSLATITLTLSEKPVKAEPKEDDDPGFVDALAGGWDAFVTMLRWLAVAFGALLPFAVALALLALLWLRVVRPRLPRRPAPEPTTALGPLPQARPVPAPGRGDEEGERD